jgi:hypothetical protein
MLFIPGKLELAAAEGTFVVSVEGREIFRTRSRTAAVEKFNGIRRDMEQRFPFSGPTPEEMKAMLGRMLNDVAADETLRRPPRKRSTARSSRTFGG